MKYIETIFAISLFLLYVLLWKIKEINQKKRTGVNPQVFDKSTSNMQKYIHYYTKFLMIYASVAVLIHSMNFQFYSFLTRLTLLDPFVYDICGFIIGIAGLSLCLYAQIKMGASWRVGIDEKVKTELVTTGLYSIIRNPTYTGLLLLNAGLWLIWPTWSTFLLVLFFTVFLEVQVRCEEDFLTEVHGGVYIAYKKKTKRYIPFIY